MAAASKPGRAREVVILIWLLTVLSEIASGIPTLIMVPLIMILSIVGTTVIVGLLMGLIRLVFGEKAIDFIKSIPQRLNNAGK